jgi:NADH-quinone oxidoreductase subunit C
MALESVDIQSKLQETFGDHVKYFRTEYDMFVLEADVDVVYNVIKFLKEEIPHLNVDKPLKDFL